MLAALSTTCCNASGVSICCRMPCWPSQAKGFVLGPGLAQRLIAPPPAQVGRFPGGAAGAEGRKQRGHAAPLTRPAFASSLDAAQFLHVWPVPASAWLYSCAACITRLCKVRVTLHEAAPSQSGAKLGGSCTGAGTRAAIAGQPQEVVDLTLSDDDEGLPVHCLLSV